MGLRIVDRVRSKLASAAAQADDLRRRQGLEWEAARSYASIDGGELSEDAFLAKLHATQARLLAPEEMLGRAVEVRASIRRMHASAGPIHAKIDIATLIELL
jgi:hypothetical protein